jgi:molecular chaperone IbpA
MTSNSVNSFSMSYGLNTIAAASSVTSASIMNGTLTTFPSTTTYLPAVYTTYGGSDVSKHFIGWDEQMKSLEKIGERIIKNSGNFPPYNVIKEDEDTFLIEFAVAGFSKDEIEISQEKNALIIEGFKDEDDDRVYVSKGIATRSFTRAFALAEYVEVKGATFKDGILTVKLVRVLPKEDQPKKIAIK